MPTVEVSKSTKYQPSLVFLNQILDNYYCSIKKNNK